MRLTISVLIVLSGVLSGVFAPVRAQSLAEVARKAEEGRKSTKPAGKVYTNGDLIAASATGPEIGTVSTAPSDAGRTQEIRTAEPQMPAGEDLPAKDQSYWGKRMAELREQLDRDTTFAEALQTRVNSLTTDFVNRDDPAQRTRIGTDRQKAVAELDRLKKSIEDGKKAVADLEDEARRAGVPPGWLR
jgi:hypothetical protein